jgi:adhesin transport system membrane fusion protein
MLATLIRFLLRTIFLPIIYLISKLPLGFRKGVIARFNRADSRLRVSALLLGRLFAYEADDREKASSQLLTVITFFTLVFLAWGYFAQIDQVIQAEAKVYPFSRLQSIEHFEGGRVSAINVRQGEQVKAGDVLITLSPLQAGSEYVIRKDSVGALGIRLARLNAELDERSSFPIPPNVGNEFREVVATERAQFVERRSQRQAAVSQKRSEISGAESRLASARAAFAGAEQEEGVVRQLVERGLEPKLSLIRIEKTLEQERSNVRVAEQDIIKAEQALQYLLKEQRTGILSEISEVRSQYTAASEDIKVAADKADRTKVRSPINGVVNRVLVSTMGGTVKPGETIVEIVPEGSTIIVEANVLPSDIGFVEVGQKALVKLTAYDFSIFGAIEGYVDLVAADSVTNDKGETFYVVRIDLKRAFLKTQTRTLKIIPGMTAQVDIITGSRNAWEYVFSPIARVLQESMREK